MYHSKLFGAVLTATMLMLPVVTAVAGSGDVQIRINGDDDVAYIGETNNIEFWIRNDEALTGMVLSFEFHLSGRGGVFWDEYSGIAGIRFSDEVSAAFDSALYQRGHCCVDPAPEGFQKGIEAHSKYSSLAAHDSYFLAFVLELPIPADQEEAVYGLVIDNVNFENSNPWEFTANESTYPPDFSGRSNVSITDASAPALRFHVVYPDHSACCVGRVGDVNGSGGDEPTISDISVLIDLLFISGGNLFCFAEGDINQSGDLSIADISQLIDYLFITGKALPNCP
jgi:hypothetical protein